MVETADGKQVMTSGLNAQPAAHSTHLKLILLKRSAKSNRYGRILAPNPEEGYSMELTA
jgi:hypothetical protein